MTTPTSHIMDHGDYHAAAGRSSPASDQQLTPPIYSCVANEDDEEGVLMRYGSHGHLADQDADESRTNNTLSDESHRQSIIGDKDLPLPHEKEKSIPREKIKDAINGMRRADENAQLQRSTRRFLAMSEAQRTPQTLTQTICLSPWCDFSHGRGMALMLGAVSLCLITAMVLGSQGQLGLGIGTVILGVSIILVRRFWVPLYWLVWGQFVEKRRRRNMQLYDTLQHGDHHRGRSSLSVLNSTSAENMDVDGEIEFSNDNNGLANEVVEEIT